MLIALCCEKKTTSFETCLKKTIGLTFLVTTRVLKRNKDFSVFSNETLRVRIEIKGYQNTHEHKGYRYNFQTTKSLNRYSSLPNVLYHGEKQRKVLYEQSNMLNQFFHFVFSPKINFSKIDFHTPVNTNFGIRKPKNTKYNSVISSPKTSRPKWNTRASTDILVEILRI